MEISPRRSQSLDFETSVASPAASSYPSTYINCRNSMYTMPGSKLPSEAKVAKPFAVRSSPSADSAKLSALPPKKDNFWSSMFGALLNIMVERFTRGSFASNISGTLSVTVVPNEGIISQDFFKKLTQGSEQLASENNKEMKESTRITERLPNKSFYNGKSPKSHIFTDDVRTSNALSGKVSLNLKNNTIARRESNENSCGKNNKTEVDIKRTPRVVQENNDKICQNNTSTIKYLHTDVIAANGCVCPTINSTEAKTEINGSYSSRSAVPKMESSSSETAIPEESGCTVWPKVVNGMNEHSDPRTVSLDSEDPTKKGNLAKPRRKTCPVARGRGKGRGKSQLRRSGVSQSRHRKERTKQNIYSNIQDDLEDWEDSERYEESDNEESLPSSQKIGHQPCQDSDRTRHCSTLFENFTFDESSTKSRKRKQRIRDRGVKCPMRVRYVSESMEVKICGNGFIDEVDCTSIINNFRPRLVSESSVDSEDSYCIVFESGSDSEYTDYDYDAVGDEDFDEDDKTTPRVRFNLEPRIHTMYQWDYAYRAARRGPWEEMARDRERFRGRIHCIERILDPILAAQHRKRVWQNRFDV